MSRYKPDAPTSADVDDLLEVDFVAAEDQGDVNDAVETLSEAMGAEA